MDNIQKVVNELVFYIKGKMLFSTEMDSCDIHNLTHTDTEILGVFCDLTNIHGNDLIDVLIKGCLNK